MKMLFFVILTFSILFGSSRRATAESSSTPDLVNLGYAKHIPTLVNETASGRRVRIYKNIRFANPPTSELRFRLPDTDLPVVDGVQDGKAPDLANNCISSAPAVAPFPPYNGTTWGKEDCLFLDVYVPDNVQPSDDVPVLHWTVGGGYVFGSKDMFVSPMGLYDLVGDDTKFIYVAHNYRLGIPGWTYLPGEDMVANLGMHDTFAAGQWISKYISRFGGDPNSVTVMGQSAGGGIVNLLTVLNGGEGTLPFQQAITLSPSVPPRVNPIDRQKNLFNKILGSANCTSLDCLRSVSEDTIKDINDYLINQIPSDAGGGVFGPAPGFGPILDGVFIPDVPQTLHQQGKFHKELQSLIVGSTANEGMGLNSDEGMPDAFGELVRMVLPTATDETIADIQSYYDFGDTPEKLAWDWTTDMVFACNAANIAAAYKDTSKRYIFSVPPATHEEDLLYAFYTDQESTPVDNPDDAREFQRNLLDFLYGREIDWPVYGSDKQLVNITSSGYKDVQLPTELYVRCKMINRVAMDPANGA